MEQATSFVGMDVHKASINVAVAYAGSERVDECQVVNEEGAVRRLVRRILREAPGPVRFCYEAGPCGFALLRQIEATDPRASCVVIAPSLIPHKPGERIKTDRRDARKLLDLDRAGLLTEVCPPTAADEAVRDLVRAREDVRQDLQRARQRLSKLLLRRAFAAPMRAWSRAHMRWLRTVRFEHAADQAAFDDYLLAVDQIEERRHCLDLRLAEVAQQAPYAAVVGKLRCFRGIDTLTAVSLVAELHSFLRFPSARDLMGYLGLVPSEYSSGSSSRRGSITKAGNAHARRLMIEAAWHYRHRVSIAKVSKRRKGQPSASIALADKAQARLHRRFRKLNARGLPAGKVVVAVARELSGFVWAALQPSA